MGTEEGNKVVETPEGFSRLYKATDSFRGQLGTDIDKALELLTEMSERLSKAEQDWYRSIGAPKNTSSPYTKVLNSFREWK